jgi:hypothetical protein
MEGEGHPIELVAAVAEQTDWGGSIIDGLSKLTQTVKFDPKAGCP